MASFKVLTRGSFLHDRGERNAGSVRFWRKGVRRTCGPMAPHSGRDCVKSLRSSYTGSYPQSGAVKRGARCAKADTNLGRRAGKGGEEMGGEGRGVAG